MSAAISFKEVRELLASLEEQGCTIIPTRKGWRVLFPNGTGTTMLHRSYSDHRSYNNLRADIRRGGLHWPFDGPNPRRKK